MRVIIFLVIFLVFSINTMDGVMSAIVTNTKAKVFKEVGKKNVVNYRFKDREILFIEEITNINDSNWYYFKKRYKGIKGWITGEFGILYTNENDIYNIIISNEAYDDYYKYYVWDVLYEAKVSDYNNGYYSLFYYNSGELDGEYSFSLYLRKGGELRRVIKSYIGENVVFKNGYIILYNERWADLEVYTTNELVKGKYDNKEYYKRTWEYKFREIEPDVNLYPKDTLTFDEKSGILTVHLEYKSGVKKEFKYIFKDGVFELLSQSEVTNSKDYYILTGDNVNVRSEASTNSAVLLKLKKGARVKLLERSDISFTIGDKTGNWVYIDTGVKDKKGNTIKGWIVDVYLKEE